MLKRWQFWAGLVISAVFLYIFMIGLRPAEVWRSLQTAQYVWIIPGIAVYFVGVWVRSWRWHYLLRPLKKIPTATMFPIVTIGYMGNNVFPARAGEVLRAVILKQREGVPVSASLATVIIERIFDGVVMLAFVFVNLPELARLTNNSGELGNMDIRTIAVAGTVVFLGALAVFLLAAMFPRATERILDRILPVIPQRIRGKTRDLALRFLTGLESLRSPFEALMIFFTTVIIWLLETVKYWFVLQAFGAEGQSFAQVTFFALMLMNGIANLITTLPSAPGYIGTFEAASIAVLKAYGVPGEIAASYTLVLHAALYVPITVLGAYYYFRQPLRWGKQVTAQAET
jgi:hypothetical protein